MPARHIPPEPWTGRDDPEDGEFAKRIHHLMSDDGNRAILGFACDSGVVRNRGRAGAKEGPTALRKALANLAVPADASSLHDLGDVAVENDDLEDGQSLLAEQIAVNLYNLDRLVVFGGGHETAFGSYSGLHRKYPDKRIGIINLDAHLDLRLPGEKGPSSGTPFTQIRELNPGNFDYLCIGLALESNTQALLRRADNWDVKTIYDRELLENPAAADGEIEAIIARSDLIYLTLCLDVLPHYQAPGVSAPAARGLPLAIVENVVSKVLRSSREQNRAIPVADIVELSPPHDRDDMTAKTAAFLARQLLFS